MNEKNDPSDDTKNRLKRIEDHLWPPGKGGDQPPSPLDDPSFGPQGLDKILKGMRGDIDDLLKNGASKADVEEALKKVRRHIALVEEKLKKLNESLQLAR